MCVSNYYIYKTHILTQHTHTHTHTHTHNNNNNNNNFQDPILVKAVLEECHHGPGNQFCLTVWDNLRGHDDPYSYDVSIPATLLVYRVSFGRGGGAFTHAPLAFKDVAVPLKRSNR